MEATKSHNLPSASCRTGKAGDVIQSESKGLWTRSTNVRGLEKMDIPPQGMREKIFPFFAFLFYLALQWIHWCPPTLVRVNILTQYIESNANCFRKHPHRQSQNNVLPISGHPVDQSSKLTHKINHHIYCFMIIRNVFTFWL